MSFQIKSFASIAASIINYARAAQKKVTDFTPGSVARTMLESPAVEIEQLYIQFFNGLLEAIPAAIYRSFDFDLLPAESATGPINVVLTAQATDTVIPAGTTWTLQGTSAKFTNPADVTIVASDTTGQVRVVSEQTGSTWNVPGGSVFTMLPQVNGFVSATAAADFDGGTDLETEDERKQRFTDFVRSLPRGTEASFDYALKNLVFLTDANGLEIERVQSWFIDQQWERDHSLPRALVDVYVFNGVDGASGNLIQRASDVLLGYVDSTGTKVPGYKAAGVHVNVYGATISDLAVAATYVVAPGFDAPTVAAAAQVAVTNYILALPIGNTAFPEAMTTATKDVPGLLSFKVTTPSGPTTPALGTKYLAGAFTLTQDTTSYITT